MTEHRRALALALPTLLLAAIACGGHQTEPVASSPPIASAPPQPTPLDAGLATVPPPRTVGECQPLPAKRPSAVSIAATRTVVPLGGSTRHEVGEVVSAPAQCEQRAEFCRTLSAAELDLLYALAVHGSLDRLVRSSAQRSPHYGSRDVTITWPGGRCAVGESSSVAFDEQGAVVFGELFDAVVEAYARAPVP